MNVRLHVQAKRSPLTVGEQGKDLGSGRGVQEGKMLGDLRLEGDEIWQLKRRSKNFPNDKVGDKTRVVESASSLRTRTLWANLSSGLKTAVLWAGL